MPEKQFETGRGTKQLIGSLVLSATILSSTFMMGMKIQSLINGLQMVTNQHAQILEMKPCRQN